MSKNKHWYGVIIINLVYSVYYIYIRDIHAATPTPMHCLVYSFMQLYTYIIVQVIY